MPQKVCPRCGSQYATLKSATCPQCFAKLIEVDDDTAAEMAAARAAVEQSPEYQKAKAEEDETFRHQSFQACVAVIAMAIAIVVLGVALIVTAKRREHRLAKFHSSQPRTTAPAVQARVEDVMPQAVGSFNREKMDERALLSGTVILIYHAAYVPSSGPSGGAIDVYAMALDRPAAELTRFRDVVQLAALAGTKPRSVTEITAKPFLYEIVGAAGGGSVNDDFNRAWKLQVGAS